MANRFYSIKEEVRVVGFDDGPLDRDSPTSLVVGAVFRGGRWLDGVVSCHVEVDGTDSTDRLIELVNGFRFKDVRVILLDGIAFAGFNVVDIRRLHERTGLSVIVVTRSHPDFPDIRRALGNLPDGQMRYSLMEAAGEPKPVETRPGKHVHIQHAGIEADDAEAIVRLTATRSLIPEPIRCAHLIAAGIISGESKGGA